MYVRGCKPTADPSLIREGNDLDKNYGRILICPVSVHGDLVNLMENIMSDNEYQNQTIREVLDGSKDTGPVLNGSSVKTGDYEAAKQLKEFYKISLRGRTFYSVLNVVRRHRAAKRKATAVPAGA